MKHLQDILDRKSYERLVNTMGGMRVWIPKPGNLGHRDRKYFRGRNERILRLRKRGRSIDAIARLFDLSPKRVYGILNARKFAVRGFVRRN